MYSLYSLYSLYALILSLNHSPGRRSNNNDDDDDDDDCCVGSHLELHSNLYTVRT